MRNTIVLITFGLLLLFGIRALRDPHRTTLPFGTRDLSAVQAQLSRLPLDEARLVEAYVSRSGGDVLPAAFADPDSPFTARTFAEAIDLQRKWNARAQLDAAALQSFRARSQARLAPLLAIVSGDLVDAQIITRNEYQALRDSGFYQRPYSVDKSPVFVSHVRVRNLGDQRLVSVKGSLHARDTHSPLRMIICWVDSQQDIDPGASMDFYCGHDYRQADQQQTDFVKNPDNRFTVEWEPHYVKLTDGRELDSGL